MLILFLKLLSEQLQTTFIPAWLPTGALRSLPHQLEPPPKQFESKQVRPPAEPDHHTLQRSFDTSKTFLTLYSSPSKQGLWPLAHAPLEFLSQAGQGHRKEAVLMSPKRQTPHRPRNNPHPWTQVPFFTQRRGQQSCRGPT